MFWLNTHLLVTPVQLMRHGIARNMSCVVGDYLLKEVWFVDCMFMHAVVSDFSGKVSNR